MTLNLDPKMIKVTASTIDVEHLTEEGVEEMKAWTREVLAEQIANSGLLLKVDLATMTTKVIVTEGQVSIESTVFLKEEEGED